jgi:endonuclease YncB( thermonuclease family)
MLPRPDEPGVGPERAPGGLALLGAAALACGLVLVASPSAREAAGGWLRDSAGGPGPAERAVVARVVDGDTLELADGRTVRVLGIDTPETHNPSLTGPQPLGEEASRRTRAQVEGRAVALEADVTDRDAYGRLLRHVWLGRRLLAEDLLAQGLARAYLIPPDTRHDERLRAAEAAARSARRGLWGLPRPTSLPIFGASGPALGAISP